MNSQGLRVRRPIGQRDTVRSARFGRARLRVAAAVTTLPQQVPTSTPNDPCANRVQFKKVTPVGERIFVKVREADIKTAGGLVLPTSAQKASTEGDIVGVSQGCFLDVGDHVIYGKYSGADLSVSGVAHVLLKEEDVIGIMTGGEVAKLQPLGDRILVKVSKSEGKTSAGVLLTSAAMEKPSFGTVVNVGPGKKVDGKRTPPNVSVGSTILYSEYSGTELRGKDETEYIVIRETDVLAELG